MKDHIVPFACPDCDDKEIEDVAKVIKSGWLTTASKAFQFEKEFSEVIGAKYCLAVNSCTAALHLGLEALCVGNSDKVIVPVHTFTATSEVVRYLGADPIFVDIDRDTFCLTVESVERGLEVAGVIPEAECIKALIPVHFAGQSCDMSPIMKYARKYGVKVIEDAAHAFPTLYRPSQYNHEHEDQAGTDVPMMVGTIGDITCFSFYANKTITTGEGGMLATDDPEIAARAKVMRLHGINRDIWNRFSDTAAEWAYDVIAPGFKYNMPDLNAAMGIQQLRKAEGHRKKRQTIADIYCQEFKNIPGLTIPEIRCARDDHSWHLFIVLIDSKTSINGIDRDNFINKLKNRNIGTSVHYIPLHRMTYYKERYGLKPEMFPNSEWVFQRCVSLPIYSAMTDSQVNYVVDSVKNVMSEQ